MYTHCNTKESILFLFPFHQLHSHLFLTSRRFLCLYCSLPSCLSCFCILPFLTSFHPLLFILPLSCDSICAIVSIVVFACECANVWYKCLKVQYSLEWGASEALLPRSEMILCDPGVCGICKLNMIEFCRSQLFSFYGLLCFFFSPYYLLCIIPLSLLPLFHVGLSPQDQ